jgi:hypothetical protein
MFDLARKQAADAAKATSPGQNNSFAAWDHMNPEDLVTYRDQITAALGKKIPLSLKDLSIETELLIQFDALRRLQSEIFADEGTPGNQKAQVANSLGSVLAKLADLQTEVYESERFKRVENAVIRFIMGLPADQQVNMLDQYEAAVRSVSMDE